MLHTVPMFIRVCPYEIKYLKIEVRNPYYHEELIELNPGFSFYFKLEDVQLTVLMIKMSRFCLVKRRISQLVDRKMNAVTENGAKTYLFEDCT